jgi:hypothetical protein
MADDVDAFVAAKPGQLLNGLAQPYGCSPDVLGQQAVVKGRERLEPAAPKRAFQDGENRVIVNEPVHHQDWRGGRCYVVVEESTLFGSESAEIVTAMLSAGTSRCR